MFVELMPVQLPDPRAGWGIDGWASWRGPLVKSAHAFFGDRFVPRHEDELELEVDDPLLVELQAEDYWYEAYNMRTGARGIFPAYYAIEVTKEPEHMAGSVPFPLPGATSPHIFPDPICCQVNLCSRSQHSGRGPSRGDFGSVLQLIKVRPGQVGTSVDCGTLCWLCHSSLQACFPALTKNSDWVDQFRVKFLGSVQVPYHKGNDVLCAAMQKVPASRSLEWMPTPSPVPVLGDGHPAPDVPVPHPQIATTRRLTVHFNPPSSCVLEISVRGVKIGVKADDSQEVKVTALALPLALPPDLPPLPCRLLTTLFSFSSCRGINVATFSS